MGDVERIGAGYDVAAGFVIKWRRTTLDAKCFVAGITKRYYTVVTLGRVRVSGDRDPDFKLSATLFFSHNARLLVIATYMSSRFRCNAYRMITFR